MEDIRCTKYTEVDWVHYIADAVPETVREAMEAHLLECGHCLDVYTAGIERQLAQNGEPVTVETDAIMAHITSSIPLPRWGKPARSSFTRSTLAHYLIAASITLLLVGSGAFDLFAAGTHAYAAQQEAVSIASEWPQQWVAKAKGWIGGWTHIN
ncbi:MAG: group-specific protein [Paenibacillaceae bacterium]|jgi:hypothetical protein|nr:group-specific protein [Paenibacillaceae bacterium]